ncbi:helix-turn-helix domain-containing protein [Pseudomonas graminis]|uniref:helix-turn-helix domain-containing protein n=1 Tax=Pseudomonas graminis TaxID=158627 RepID=UPI0009441C4F|nr:AraC family transcriptional regulator [Pseudomonas graminis]
MANTGRKLLDIGPSRGFAERSTLCRAFKRWTGQTPVQWRLQNAANPKCSDRSNHVKALGSPTHERNSLPSK